MVYRIVLRGDKKYDNYEINMDKTYNYMRIIEHSPSGFFTIAINSINDIVDSSEGVFINTQINKLYISTKYINPSALLIIELYEYPVRRDPFTIKELPVLIQDWSNVSITTDENVNVTLNTENEYVLSRPNSLGLAPEIPLTTPEQGISVFARVFISAGTGAGIKALRFMYRYLSEQETFTDGLLGKVTLTAPLTINIYVNNRKVYSETLPVSNTLSDWREFYYTIQAKADDIVIIEFDMKYIKYVDTSGVAHTVISSIIIDDLAVYNLDSPIPLYIKQTKDVSAGTLEYLLVLEGHEKLSINISSDDLVQLKVEFLDVDLSTVMYTYSLTDNDIRLSYEIAWRYAKISVSHAGTTSPNNANVLIMVR